MKDQSRARTNTPRPTKRSTAKRVQRRTGNASEVAVEAESSEPQDRRLDTILRALPDTELKALVQRMGIRIDTKKRIDTPAQVARVLVRLPDLREPARLPPASVELLHRVAESTGTLVVGALPAGIEVLVRRGIVYARMVTGGIELMLPTAFLVQLRSWEGEDPRSLRALLAEAPFETASAIASHYLGRPATPPIALSLEPAWEILSDYESLREEVERASHQERRLLDAIEEVGGEVDTQELMDLEREPMRVRGVYGVAAGRRGAAFSLEKRGLLFPVYPNRYVIPTEVMAIIGAERSAQRERRRERIRCHVIEQDHLPRRARFSVCPAPLALAMAMVVREGGSEVKPGVGTPRSLINRLGQRFGRELEPSALVIALSRAVGLWGGAAVSSATPPGSLQVYQLSRLLFDTWRRGGAWDEGRSEAELLRVGQELRDPSPAGIVREIVLDALQDLGEEQWVPYAALMAYIDEDPRARGLERLFARWANRAGVETPLSADVARRILLESLPTLGAVDLGGADINVAGSGETSGLALRLTSRGRSYIAGRELSRNNTDSEFTEGRVLRVGMVARVADVIELGPFADISAVEQDLELSFTNAAISRGLSAGIDPDRMNGLVESLCALSGELAEALNQAATVIGRTTLVGVGGFLWVEDEDIRAMLLRQPPTAELFVDPSPPAGLLIAQGVDSDRVVRKCRAVGVEVDVEQQIVRPRTSSVPAPRRSDTSRRTRSWRPPAARSTSSSRRRKTTTG